MILILSVLTKGASLKCNNSVSTRAFVESQCKSNSEQLVYLNRQEFSADTNTRAALAVLIFLDFTLLTYFKNTKSAGICSVFFQVIHNRR